MREADGDPSGIAGPSFGRPVTWGLGKSLSDCYYCDFRYQVEIILYEMRGFRQYDDRRSRS